MIIEECDYVKVGDNSVHTVNITDKVLAEYEDITLGGVPNFNVKFATAFDNGVGVVDYIANEVRVTSRLTRRSTANAYHPSHFARGIALYTFGHLPAPELIDYPRVTFDQAASIGKIEESMVAPYLICGAPNLKNLESTLGSILQSTTQVNRNIGAWITNKRQIVDNTAFYAKIMWYAVTLNLITETGRVPAATPWDDNNRVNYISLTNPATTADNIGAAIAALGFVFVENIDYQSPNDDVILQWIAQGSRRILAEVAGILPHMALVDWQPIPITVLIRAAAAPQIGDARCPDADALIRFALRQANARGENESLSKAIYWVMEHSGVEMKETARAGRWHARWPDLGVGNLVFSAPDDYNVLLRLLHIKPMQKPEYLPDIEKWTQATPRNRLSLTALYNLSFSTFCTTALYNGNYDCLGATRWATGENDPRPFVNAYSLDFFYPDYQSKSEPLI